MYGSRARNEATEDSDWDLLILLDKPKIEDCSNTYGMSSRTDCQYSMQYLHF